jgi:hypothetical protein
VLVPWPGREGSNTDVVKGTCCFWVDKAAILHVAWFSATFWKLLSLPQYLRTGNI